MSGDAWPAAAAAALLMLLACGGVGDCDALKIVSIKVPQAVVRKHDAVLKCLFELEGEEKLYAVKWYRGQHEFYRFTPRDKHPVKQFKIRGISVKEKESNATQVVLSHVDRDISGTFSCEVTADQPSFFTDMRTAGLQVVDLPQKDPYISGLKTRYRLGDVLKANCTSEDANPPANLTWYVNGIPVEEAHVKRHSPSHSLEGRTLTAHSTIRLQISNVLAEGGRLKVRCAATMHHLYHRSSERVVVIERKQRHRRPALHSWLEPALEASTAQAPPVYGEWGGAPVRERPPQATIEFHPGAIGRAATIKNAFLVLLFSAFNVYFIR